MLWGGFECAAYPNRLLTWDGAEGCCIGGGLRALYLVWRASLAETENESRVNIGFSRSSPYVEVVGHEPWAGLIEARAHGPPRLLIRLPEHIGASEVRALLDGGEVDVAFDRGYAVFDGLRAGQVAAISYPLRESERAYEIAGKAYTGIWRGSTMMEIRPAGERYPIYAGHSVLFDGDPAVDALKPARQAPVPPVPVLW